MSKPIIQFSRTWFIFFLVVGVFVSLFGLYNLNMFEFSIIGPIVIGMGFFFRAMSKTVLHKCVHCLSLINEGATVCHKCGRDQPKNKEAA
jgi:hypothetical protein